ncbi:MAG: hypothetical protein U9R01_08665, partial [candidate division WOR-3 bacterium]|nr:hypothetical protein [candidate division WOR-3 bacterium]
AGQPYYKPADFTAVIGSVLYATTVQTRIINITTEPDEVWTGAAWISTVTYLAGCTDSTYVIGESTCGFIGTDDLAWSNNIGNIWPAGTNKFEIKVRGHNDSEDIAEPTPFEARYFHIDGDVPDSTLINPNAEYENPFPQIMGTASDAGLGYITDVQVAISTGNTARYWDGAFWVASSSWLVVNADDGNFDENEEYWYLNTQLPPWETDISYEVRVKITDKAGNIKTKPSPYFQFTIDISTPVAEILIPSTETVRSLGAISGTTYDNGKNKTVEIAIKKEETGFWYSGTSFELGTINWINIDGGNGFLSPDATSWIYSPAGLDDDFASNANYLILTRAQDVADNLQTVLTVDISSMVIGIDKEKPSSSISRPLDNGDGQSGRYQSADMGQTGNNTQIEGTVIENPADTYAGIPQAGGAYIRLSYLLSNDTYYWTGASFSSHTVDENTAWQGASNSYDTGQTWDWYYMTDISWPGGDREYSIEVKTMDDSRLSDASGDGNWEIAPYTIKRFIIDDSPPSVDITTPT